MSEGAPALTQPVSCQVASICRTEHRARQLSGHLLKALAPCLSAAFTVQQPAASRCCAQVSSGSLEALASNAAAQHGHALRVGAGHEQHRLLGHAVPGALRQGQALLHHRPHKVGQVLGGALGQPARRHTRWCQIHSYNHLISGSNTHCQRNVGCVQGAFEVCLSMNGGMMDCPRNYHSFVMQVHWTADKTPCRQACKLD